LSEEQITSHGLKTAHVHDKCCQPQETSVLQPSLVNQKLHATAMVSHPRLYILRRYLE